MNIETVAKVGGVFALLVLVHFVADWVFQSHDEAMRKPKDNLIRAKHCTVYTLLCTSAISFFGVSWVICLQSAFILWLSHFLEDTYLPVFVWARYIRKPGPMNTLKDFVAFAETPLGKILLIAVDQIVHLVFLVPVACMVVAPQTFVLSSILSVVGLGFLTVVCYVARPYMRPAWKLWLDDQIGEVPARAVPEGYVGARTSAEAKLLVIQLGLPEYMDLDHDLGGEDTAMIFLKWLTEKFPKGPCPKFDVHSENPAGAASIKSYLNTWHASLWMD
jgi:hypothetical protein